VSNASDTANVTLSICDFAIIDPASNKPTIIGAAQTILQAQPHTDPNLPDHVITPPFSIYANITLPHELSGEQYVLSVDLRDSTGEIVNLPNSENKLRFNQIVNAEVPNFPPDFPHHRLPAQHNITINFASGLPLLPQSVYYWTIQIDGNDNPHWVTPMLVLPSQINPDSNPNIHQPLIG